MAKHKPRMIIAIPERPPKGGRMIHGEKPLDQAFFRDMARSYDPSYRRATILSGYEPFGAGGGDAHFVGMTLPPLGFIDAIFAEKNGNLLTAEFSEVNDRVERWIKNGFDQRSIFFLRSNPELRGGPPYLMHVALVSGEIVGIPGMPPLSDLLEELADEQKEEDPDFVFNESRILDISGASAPVESRTVEMSGKKIELDFSRLYSPENKREVKAMKWGEVDVLHILPLFHHAERLVVQIDDLDRQAILQTRGQFLHVHHETTFAGNAYHSGQRFRKLHSHGRRQPIAHCPQTTRANPASRLVKLVVLGSEHLMLTHVAGHNRVSLRHFI